VEVVMRVMVMVMVMMMLRVGMWVVVMDNVRVREIDACYGEGECVWYGYDGCAGEAE
jgi:Na+-translocating ferredoxin:NAD+ oxidoreductase RNF subunit RnfB